VSDRAAEIERSATIEMHTYLLGVEHDRKEQEHRVQVGRHTKVDAFILLECEGSRASLVHR